MKIGYKLLSPVLAGCILIAMIYSRSINSILDDIGENALLDKSISGQAEVYWGKTSYHKYPKGTVCKPYHMSTMIWK